MKSISDPALRQDLHRRISLLQEDSKPLWGKMNVWQMTRHCNNWSEWLLGRGPYTGHVYRQDLLGKLFGRWALRSNTKDDRPMQRNMPAGKLAIKDTTRGNLEGEKALWIQLTDDCALQYNEYFIHDFFGRMTAEQISIFAYKHYDHHLRQFGV